LGFIPYNQNEEDPFLMLLISFCFSCKEESSNVIRKTTGKVNNISVIDDQQWNGEIGDSIRNKFAFR
jgi:hypothetical protein